MATCKIIEHNGMSSVKKHIHGIGCIEYVTSFFWYILVLW